MLIRYFLLLLFAGFIFKIAVQARASDDSGNVPKSLLLGSLPPEQPLPAGKIDNRKILAKLREN